MQLKIGDYVTIDRCTDSRSCKECFRINPSRGCAVKRMFHEEGIKPIIGILMDDGFIKIGNYGNICASYDFIKPDKWSKYKQRLLNGR